MLAQAASVGLLLCITTAYLALAHHWRGNYESMPSLDLPGAQRIHLPKAQGRDYLWLVQNVENHCDVFIGMPELPSLHIWTDKDAVAGFDMDDWMLFYSPEQQVAASEILSRYPNACEIYNPDLVAFWNRTNQDMSAYPLARYLHDNFTVVGQKDRFSFLVRNGRDVSLLAIP